jgi:hypothetical protein
MVEESVHDAADFTTTNDTREMYSGTLVAAFLR